MKLISFLIAFTIPFLKLSRSEDLIFAQLYIRHGARTPTSLYDKGEDRLKEKWPGKGEITGVGQRMEYILGLRNRQRYITGKFHFLSEAFDPHELLILSSDKNRTILSMASLLQGLYPISSKMGEKLNPQQIKMALPQVNVSSNEIQQEIENLNDSALPNYMTLIPIHVISPYEKKILNFERSDCSSSVSKLKKKNVQEKETIKNLTNNFNKNYASNMNKFFNNSEDYIYDFDFISSICDNVDVANADGRNMTSFFTITNINKQQFLEDCEIICTINCRDELYGDEKNEMILLEASPILRDMISTIKRRVNSDINNEKPEENVSDYTKPKMVMILGHDDSITSQVLFIMKYFNLNLDIYKLPNFASQMAFEVTRNEKDSNKKLNYSDYHICYYFDDELYINVTLDHFIDVVENNIWTTNQMENFCKGNDNNGKDDNNSKENTSKNKIYLSIIICFGIIILILTIIIVILVIKLKGKKDDINEEDNMNKNILNNN